MMDKKKIEDIAQGLEGVRDAMAKLNDTLSGGPASYYYERIIDYYKGCMKAAKFRKGERVELKEDVDLSDCSGWVSSKHFLIKGSVATVRDVDYYQGKYRYDIEFDDETWIDHHGVKRVPDKKHTFCFYQKSLKRNKV